MKRTKRPFVSVIVPVYGVEKYVGICLESILKQTYKNIELIVVNDASPGNILDIVQDLQQRHDNIVLVDLKENVGLFRARIAGIEKAKGDLIVNIDGDDSVGIEYIERLVLRATETNADIVLAEMVEYSSVDKSKRILNLARSIAYGEVIEDEGAALAELLRRGNFFWEVCGKMYSRHIVNKAMEELTKINKHILMGEDILFNFHFFYYCRSIARAEFAFYYYRKNDESVTAKSTDFVKKKRIVQDIIFVFEKIQDFMRKKSIYEKYERQYRYLRNMQAAKYYIEVQEDFSGKNRKELLKLIDKISYDKFGFEQEVALRSAESIGDIKELRKRLEAMNSIKISGLKLLSNIKRKLKSPLN